MTIPVDVSRLAEALARYRFAYLLTASERGAPHAVAVTGVPEGGEAAAPGACGSDCVEIA